MATARTQVTNQTANPMSLPFPYKGVVFGDAVQVALLADTPAQVVANLGGETAIRGVWAVGPVPAGSAYPASYHDQSVGSTTSGPSASLPSMTVGAVLVSATTVAPSASIQHVSGTAAIVTITVPTFVTIGTRITLIPDAIFTWTAAGNISLAGTAVVNKALDMTWDGLKWNPSYIA